MKRKCLENSECAVARALEVIGDWWSLLILREAFRGKRRFSEFQKSLDIARNILSARLRKLVAHGVFELVPASDGSAFQEYALTDKGRGLFIVLVALRQWGERSLYETEESKYVVVDRQSGDPIRPLELLSQNGRLLRPEDVEIVATSEACSDSRTGRIAGGSPKVPAPSTRKSKPVTNALSSERR